MTKFRSPRRRTVRQKSGFKVAGTDKGSTCKIFRSTRIYPQEKEITLEVFLKEEVVPILFGKNVGILGVGYYFKPSGPCEVLGTISWQQNGKDYSDIIPLLKIDTSSWQKNGALFDVAALSPKTIIKNISVKITFKTSTYVDVWGLMLGSIKYSYLIDNDVSESFSEKTAIYIPEILYIDPTVQTTKFNLSIGKIDIKSGGPIICKSCNRCSRFLPIDIENGRNTLGFSNHCVSRAPCTHSSFSRYRIEAAELQLPANQTENNFVVSYFGHQLECKSCKKFFVNSPLNPLRDSTQHREDSLRRRAFEVLVIHLLERKWIYHIYRISTGKEFDVSIWEKFGKKCFNCETPIKKPTDMHLDHTLPLAYLWPLDETATCLCGTCNSSKSDKFPIDFYNKDKLPLLSKLTGVPLSTLQQRPINKLAVEELLKRVVWLFEEFLADKNYQKIRKGKKASDLTLHALHNVLHSKGYDVDLAHLYLKETKRLPTTVSVD